MPDYKKIADSQIQFTLKISKEALEKAQRAYLLEAGKEISIKGYRKGKAPSDMVIAAIGPEKLVNESFDRALNKNYQKFIQNQKLSVINHPDIKVEKQDADPVEVLCTVEIFPEVTVGDYKKISVKKEAIKVMEAEVDEVISSYCAEKKVGKEVKRGAKKQDLLEVDFVGKDEKGKTISNTEGKNQTFRLGMGQFLADLEKGYEGMKAEESKEAVPVKFPKDYHAENMAGRTVHFDITVHKVMEIDPKNLDEDLIEKLIGKKETVEDFRKNITQGLITQKEHQAYEKAMEQYYEKLEKITKTELPKSWIAREVETRMREVKKSPYYEYNPDAFWKNMKKTEIEYKKDLEAKSKTSLVRHLGLNKVLEHEKIELNKDEMEKAHHHAHEKLGDQQGHPSQAHNEAMHVAVMNLKIDKYLKSVIQ